MQQVADFLQKNLRYLLLLNLPAYVLSGVVVFIINAAAHWGLSYLAIALIAIAVNPGLWAALVLVACDARFRHRVNQMIRSPSADAHRRAFVALRRHNSAYVSLGKAKWLTKSVNLSCLFVLIPIRLRSARWDANFPGASAEEERQRARVDFERRHSALATFGLGLDGDVKKTQTAVREEALASFVERLPSELRSAQVGDVALAAYLDGDGYSTTLSVMYRIQLACALEPDLRAQLVETFGAMKVVPDELGWLTARFFQAALWVAIGAVPREQLARVEALAVDASRALREAGDDQARSSVKWDVRRQVLDLLGER
jgi:hypothetical protein